MHRRALTEYALPPAAQTHELVKLPDAPVVLVSQQSESQLVKLWLDPTTEQVIGVQAFPLGPADAMLHGLALSTRHPGLIWATHEAGNRLLLVDPGAARLDTPPRIVREINVPGGGRGARHPQTGEYYASQDQASLILRIDPNTRTSTQLPIPAEHGATPVGLVAGPGGAWVTLLGTSDQGNPANPWGRAGVCSWRVLASSTCRCLG